MYSHIKMFNTGDAAGVPPHPRPEAERSRRPGRRGRRGKNTIIKLITSITINIMIYCYYHCKLLFVLLVV